MRSASHTSTCRSPRTRSGVRSTIARADRRALAYGLAASLALHGAVLALRVATVSDAPSSSPQLVVRVTPVEAAQSALPAAKQRIARREQQIGRASCRERV